MRINFWLNGVKKEEEICPDTLLLDFLRSLGCYSVKRGCETANCGLCTVLVEGRPMLSCSVLAARIDGKRVMTMEGLQEEAKEFGTFLANEGAEQCGFCNPGFIMNVIAMTKEAQERYGRLPVLYAGGVMSNQLIRPLLAENADLLGEKQELSV